MFLICKQEAHGPLAHRRNQFKSMNTFEKTYDYTITLIKRGNKRPMGHIANLRNQLKSMNTFEQSYDYIYYEIGPVVLEDKIFNFRECTSAIFLIFP